MGQIIFPTENDLGGAGLGRDLREESWTKVIGRIGINHVLTGMTIATSANLTFTLETGTAIIAGMHVDISTPQLTVLCTASVRNYIWLKLNRTSNIVTAAALEARTTNDVPSGEPRYYMKICEAICSGTAITSVEDYRPGSPNLSAGSYIGDGSGSNRNIILGFRTRLVIIHNSTANLHISPLGEPSNGTGFKLTTAPALTFETSVNNRPELRSDGFTISGSGAGNLNFSGETYRYIAFA